MKQPCVYILASKPHGTLYIGVISNLVARIYQHKADLVPGFSQRYSVHRLVYIQLHQEMYAALAREKQLKRWKRAWKIRLIEEKNPKWQDLYTELF
jgi:putative endonuclease